MRSSLLSKTESLLSSTTKPIRLLTLWTKLQKILDQDWPELWEENLLRNKPPSCYQSKSKDKMLFLRENMLLRPNKLFFYDFIICHIFQMTSSTVTSTLMTTMNTDMFYCQKLYTKKCPKENCWVKMNGEVLGKIIRV